MIFPSDLLYPCFLFFKLPSTPGYFSTYIPPNCVSITAQSQPYLGASDFRGRLGGTCCVFVVFLLCETAYAGFRSRLMNGISAAAGSSQGSSCVRVRVPSSMSIGFFLFLPATVAAVFELVVSTYCAVPPVLIGG